MVTTTFKSHNGIIRFYDGTIIAIEDQEYSHNGLNNWEKVFNPLSHVSTIDGVTILEGHLYKRVKHSGDENYQIPYRIVAKEPEFQTTETEVQFRLVGDTDWQTLFTLDSVTGEDGDNGEQGIQGEGFHIDQVGYILTRPDCCINSESSSNCMSCNTNANNTGLNYSTYLSLGDGAKEIILGDVGTLFRSNDGITFMAIVASDIGNLTRYTATDINGTGTIDYREQDTLGSRGVVYICSDGKWTQLMNVATPSYMVREFAGSTHIGFMNSYTAATAPALTATIVLSNGVLEVAEQSINETAFNQATFGDGIEIINPMDKPKVQTDDLVGFGLRSFASLLDTENNAQIFVQDFISDGLTFENEVTVDGEQRDLMLVNPSDLINSPNGTNVNYTGLATSTQLGYAEVDGYDNLFIVPGNAILIDSNGINVVADELSILADGLAAILLADTDSLTLGVQAKHVHMNLVDPLQGLEKINTTTGSFRVKIDSLRGSIGFNLGGGIHVPDNGIQGLHLNDNVADNIRGLEVLNDMLVTKVDGVSIGFNGSGELEIPSTYLDTVIADNTVTRISHNGQDTVGDINLLSQANDSFGIFQLNILATHNIASDDTINFILELDENVFETTVESIVDNALVYNRLTNILESSDGTIDIAFDPIGYKVDLTIASVGGLPTAGTSVQAIDGIAGVGVLLSYAREDHKHNVLPGALNIANTANLQTELNSKLELDEPYGNITIRSTGLYITSVGGTVKRLIMDDNGNLDTE